MDPVNLKKVREIVMAALDKGRSLDDVKRYMRDCGYPEDEINYAIADLKTKSQKTSATSSAEELRAALSKLDEKDILEPLELEGELERLSDVPELFGSNPDDASIASLETAYTEWGSSKQAAPKKTDLKQEVIEPAPPRPAPSEPAPPRPAPSEPAPPRPASPESATFKPVLHKSDPLENRLPLESRPAAPKPEKRGKKTKIIVILLVIMSAATIVAVVLYLKRLGLL